MEPASSSTPPVITTEKDAPVVPPETNASTGTANGQDRQDSRPTLSRVMSSPRGLKHVDPLAVLRAEAERTYQVTRAALGVAILAKLFLPDGDLLNRGTT